MSLGYIYNNKYKILSVGLLIIIILIIYIYYEYNEYYNKYNKYNELITYYNDETNIRMNIYKTPDNYELPKVIYCFWHNYEEDNYIKMFVNNWEKKLSKEWKIIIVHKNNIKEYTGDDLNKFSDLDNTKFSDYLRLYLLKEYGGVWIDISIMIINGYFLDSYHEEMINTKSDALLYEYKDKTINQDYPFLENWFIMAPKKSKLICELYDIFEISFDMGFMNFKKNILIKSEMKLDNTIGGYDDNIYLMMHACLNYLMYKGHQYKIIVKDAIESMFKLQRDTSWNEDKLGEKLCDKKNYNNLYAIKLIGTQRNHLKKLMNDSSYNKNECKINNILSNL
jgi:hypothetical protein